MKMIVLTASAAFEEHCKSILKEAGVGSYSFYETRGFMDFPNDLTNDNWFATEVDETASILFFAFVKADTTAVVFELVDHFNKQQQTVSKVHCLQFDIEKSN